MPAVYPGDPHTAAKLDVYNDNVGKFRFGLKTRLISDVEGTA
jgi:hypothetical protein